MKNPPARYTLQDLPFLEGEASKQKQASPPPQGEARKDAGRRNQRQGARLEQDLQAEAASLSLLLVRHEPKLRAVKTGGDLLFRATSPSFVDFSLWLPPADLLPARTVAFDAKTSRDPDRWTLGTALDHGHEEGKQGRLLCLLASMGFAAGVYVRGPQGDFWISWGPRGAVGMEGAKSARWEALREEGRGVLGLRGVVWLTAPMG